MIEETFSARPASRRLRVNAALAALGAVAVVAALWLAALLIRDVPVTHDDVLEQFKYGSIGTEAELGIPRPIFDVLPVLFEDLLPLGEGRGYERLGFVYEAGHALPVGTSERSKPIPLVGLNCAACHAGTLRRAPGAEPDLFPGAPATRFNSGAFLQFLVEVGSDPRFEPGRLFDAMEQRHVSLSFAERVYYRLVVIPDLRGRFAQLRKQFSWIQRRPAFGPGRADTVNPYKALLGMDMAADETVGTADYAPLYNQRIHRGSTPHWNAEGGPALAAIAKWLQDLQPPVFPRDRIDLAGAERGRAIWDRECKDCHAIGGRLVGHVTPAEAVDTDPERLGALKDADGYLNVPLDGLWVRAPYLHNGSVPTLRDLLLPPDERPEVFFRGYDAYDWDRVGYVSVGPEAEKAGFRYDTRLRGNHNKGHAYGTALPEAEKADLLQYLKTL